MTNPTVQSLFPLYSSAADYTAKTQKACPQADPTMPVKMWADPNVVPGVDEAYTFVQFGQVTPYIVQRTIPWQQAIRVNFPAPVVHYDPYVVPPTDATREGGPLTANLVCLESEAQALIAEMRATVPDAGYRLATPVEAGPDVVYGADGRKMWVLTADTEGLTGVFVGELIQIREESGVGAPGHWTIFFASGMAQLKWVSTIGQNPQPMSGPSFPVPIVPIPAGSHLERGTNIGDPLTCVIVPNVPLAAAPSAGPSLSDLQDQIAELRAMLARLLPS